MSTEDVDANDDPYEQDLDVSECEICGAVIDDCDAHHAECSQCGVPGCSRCIHDGGDDCYPELCDECDPDPVDREADAGA